MVIMIMVVFSALALVRVGVGVCVGWVSMCPAMMGMVAVFPEAVPTGLAQRPVMGMMRMGMTQSCESEHTPETMLHGPSMVRAVFMLVFMVGDISMLRMRLVLGKS